MVQVSHHCCNLAIITCIKTTQKYYKYHRCEFAIKTNYF